MSQFNCPKHAAFWSLKERMKDDSTNKERNGKIIRNNLKRVLIIL